LFSAGDRNVFPASIVFFGAKISIFSETTKQKSRFFLSRAPTRLLNSIAPPRSPPPSLFASSQSLPAPLAHSTRQYRPSIPPVFPAFYANISQQFH
jgi:hypothetical protein